MRLYLSSGHLNGCPALLRKMLGRIENPIAVVINAKDYKTPEALAQNYYQEASHFEAIGARVEPLDLKAFWGASEEEMGTALEGYSMVWAMGGNTFLLRRAMAECCFDGAIKTLLANDSLVYGGYSAGSIVMGTSMAELAAMDDPTMPQKVYGKSTLSDGLGVVPYSIVPHCKNFKHGHAAAQAMKLLKAAGKTYIGLNDSQAIVVNGSEQSVVTVA